MDKRFLTIFALVVPAAAMLAFPAVGRTACNDVTTPTVSVQATFPPDTVHGAYSYQPSVQLSSYDPDNCGGVVLWYRIGENSTYIGTTSTGLTLKMPYGYNKLYAYAVDPAGHTSAVQTSVFVVDDQAKPTATATITPSSPNGTAGWYTMTPVVTLTADDGAQGSGIQGISYKLDFDAYRPYTGPVAIPDGVHTLFYRPEDKAGLVQDYVMDFRVDTGLPQVSFTRPLPSVTNVAALLLEGYATDPISGPVAVTVAGAAIPVDVNTGKFSVNVALRQGANTLTLIATDQAGRSLQVITNVTRKQGIVLGVTANPPILRNTNKRVVRTPSRPNFKQRIILTGTNFASGAAVRVGNQSAVRVRVAEPSTIIAYVEPQRFSKGTYDITVINPDGQQSTLKAGLRIR